jgi:hypothetical protein
MPSGWPTPQKNTAVRGYEVDVDPPAYDPNDTRSAAERFVDQQWRDVAASRLGDEHPLALNRDAGRTTAKVP